MSGLSEAELHVQAMRLVCEALQDREQDGLEVDWNVLRQMHDQMDAILQALQHKHRYDSSEIVDLRKERDHWKQARATAIQGGELLLESNQKLQAEIETLKGAMAADDKRLQDAEERVWPGMTWGCDAPDKMADLILHLRQQLDAAVFFWQGASNRGDWVHDHDRPDRVYHIEALAELDADTEPTPVTERCPECDGAGMVDSGGFGPDGKGINVPCGGDCRGNPCPSQPTPVVEPLDAEGGA